MTLPLLHPSFSHSIHFFIIKDPPRYMNNYVVARVDVLPNWASQVAVSVYVFSTMSFCKPVLYPRGK